MSELKQPVNEGLDSASMVVTKSLCKRFGDFDALVDCSVQVRGGAIFGLLGPNGAGKTTLIRLLLGFLKPTSGTCSVNGFSSIDDGVSVRKSVAYLPGEAHLPQHMRGRSVLRFFADMHPGGSLKRSLAIADDLELDLRRYVAFMSTGMRQKLALAVVLAIESPLMILDEPTANLDPTVRATVLDYVRLAGRKGRTVILSSHVLSEIEETCDRVAFLRRGRLAHEQDMSEIQQQHRVTATSFHDSIDVPESLKSRVELHCDDPTRGLRIDTRGDLSSLLPWLDSLKLGDMRIEPLALRSVYDSVHFRKDSRS